MHGFTTDRRPSSCSFFKFEYLKARDSNCHCRSSHPRSFAAKYQTRILGTQALRYSVPTLATPMWFSKRQTKNLPVAFSVQPSRQLLGNDGNWSTFALRAGSDGQNFQVLVSTSSQEIWLPVPQGCATTNSTGPVPSNCPQLRGVGLTGAVQSQGFVIDNSTTRDDIGIYDLTLGPSLDINALGSMYSVDGDWDLDTASLPSAINQGISITADKVPLVGLTCWEFFVASLGLGYGILSNGYGNFSSFSESLVKASEIPSRSWAYTAGAYYRGCFRLLDTPT